MALTPEQQASVDMAVAIEADRYNKQMALQAQQAKLEAVRIAQQTLLENRRNKPVEEREVTAADITNYASTLTSYING
jgi:hypothetical protein